jgi:hypothetical protein
MLTQIVKTGNKNFSLSANGMTLYACFFYKQKKRLEKRIAIHHSYLLFIGATVPNRLQVYVMLRNVIVSFQCPFFMAGTKKKREKRTACSDAPSRWWIL